MQHPIRCLLHPPDSLQPAPALHQPLDGIDGRCLLPGAGQRCIGRIVPPGSGDGTARCALLAICAGHPLLHAVLPHHRQLHHQLIEGPSHVHGCLQHPARHPQNGVMLVVGKDRPGLDRIQELRRRGHPHQPEPLCMPVHRRPQPVSGLQVVPLGKGIAHHRLIARQRRRQPPLTQVQAVHQWLPTVVRQGNHLRRHWLIEPRQLQLGKGLYPAFHLGHLRQRRHLPRHRFRRALGIHPDVRQPLRLVEAQPAVVQRIQRHLRHHQHGNAARHHQHDGQRLAAQQPQVAQRLPVQCRQPPALSVTSAAHRHSTVVR